MLIDTPSLVQVHLCLTFDILLICFCLLDLDLMRTSIEERAHQAYDRFGEGYIRINILRHHIQTSISQLVRAVDITNRVARYRNEQ
jgi:hypothetical protein